ncbi:unnamed protein product [Nesidiocoris tenuis]|uniref:Uncharacterized protein n=1 Tax=Nesidiocoris tenuis TaxID=355587 RepID=A0A6H5HJ49_9HEMI|nr:unnamed protein product [Nesidiocoris tenuis]
MRLPYRIERSSRFLSEFHNGRCDLRSGAHRGTSRASRAAKGLPVIRFEAHPIPHLRPPWKRFGLNSRIFISTGQFWRCKNPVLNVNLESDSCEGKRSDRRRLFGRGADAANVALSAVSQTLDSIVSRTSPRRLTIGPEVFSEVSGNIRGEEQQSTTTITLRSPPKESIIAPFLFHFLGHALLISIVTFPTRPKWTIATAHQMNGWARNASMEPLSCAALTGRRAAISLPGERQSVRPADPKRGNGTCDTQPVRGAIATGGPPTAQAADREGFDCRMFRATPSFCWLSRLSDGGKANLIGS